MRRYPDATGGDSRGSEQLDGRDSRGSHPVTHYASGPRHWVSGGIDGRFDLAGKGVFEVGAQSFARQSSRSGSPCSALENQSPTSGKDRPDMGQLENLVFTTKCY